MNYYNEWDKATAAWLRELIKAGLIPRGEVDDRSISEVTPGDLKGFTQCHFFAGIAGWSRALYLAGVPATVPLWTGSPPCQPFSQAGNQKGKYDERHLAPTFIKLIKQCKPTMLFGEQVAKAIETGWLDDLQTELAGAGYAVGAAVLSASGVGAPHKRERLYFGAVNGMADPYRDQHRWALPRSTGAEAFATLGVGQNLPESGEPGGAGSNVLGFWECADKRLCRDGKYREVEPGTSPLADGIPARVERLRGYGNAIVPQVGAMFIQSIL